MFKKPIAILLLTSTFFAANASMSTASDSALVIRDHRTTDTVRDHRTKVTVRDHRTQRPNEVVPAHRKTHDCRVGSVQLWKMGYSPVVAYDCDGPAYHYTAMDGASLYRATMNAYTAELEVVFVGITK